MMYRNIEIARPRCYKRGQTKYQLEHYIDLIEKGLVVYLMPSR